jgi:NADPH:quinone reductase
MGYHVWLVDKPDGDFQKAEVPISALGRNQVRVRISASGVNPIDTWIRAGKAAHAQQPLPAGLSLDMVGTVEQAGPGVPRFQTWR